MSSNRLSPPETCRDFATLLPLASHRSLAPEVSARLNAHLASCPFCRTEATRYEVLDTALKREFALRQRNAPCLSREEIEQVLQGRRFSLIHAQVAEELAEVEIQEGQSRAVGTLPSHQVMRTRSPRRAPALFAALAAVLALSVAATGLFHLLQTRATTGTLARDLSQVTLTDLAMISADEGWAIGRDAANAGHGVLVHYFHGVWSQSSTPVAAGTLRSIAMHSASDGWIVGAQGLIMHYDGQSWQVVPSPVKTDLASVSMISASEGWAAGSDLLHYTNGAWTRVAGIPDVLSQLQMLSSTEGWAVGSKRIWRYHNGTWAPIIVASANIGAHFKTPPNYPFVQPQPLSLSMVSASEGWAVGISPENLLHYQQGTWRLAPSPNPGADLQAVAMVSADEGWAMGRAATSRQGVIYHYLRGRWNSVASPTDQPITRIVMLSSTEGWAVGASSTILHYLNGVWSVAFSG